MPRSLFNDGQEIVQGDMNAVASRVEMELYDRFLYEIRNRQNNFVFGNSFVSSYVNATTSQVLLGNGLYFDNTQVDPEPQSRLLYRPTTGNIVHAAADPSNNRIDLICITPARGNQSQQTRNFKDASTSVISAVLLYTETDWLSTLTIVAGTPAASPAVPATPAGAIALCRVLVTAATGIAGSSAYTDVRPRYKRGWKNTFAITVAYTADLDDQIITANTAGGAYALTLPLASKSQGKEFTIVKSDSSGNAVTVTASGSDLISGQATQDLLAQYATMVVFCPDGVNWFMA